jgi:hypothetical protein
LRIDDERVPHIEINPDIPQFPPGTAVALVRQLLLIDNEAHLVPSNITEAVQFRMYREIGGSPSPDRNAAKRFQDFFEFRIKREKLFGGQDGGLHAVSDSETEFPVFASHDIDIFNNDGALFSISPILESCGSCHFRPGIHSALSLNQKKLIPRAWSEAKFTIGRKRASFSWGLLKGLWKD